MNSEMTSKMSTAAVKNTITCTSFNAGSSVDSKLSKCSFSGPAWHRTEEEDSRRTSNSSTLHFDIVSQITSTLDNDQASMDNNASSKSGRITASDCDGSTPSDFSESCRASKDCSGSDDYLDNFPYVLPSRKPIPKPSTSIWSIKHN